MEDFIIYSITESRGFLWRLTSLKQISMGAGTLKSNSALFVIELINKNPIALNMAFMRPIPSAVKRVAFSLRRQGLFVDDHVHYFAEFAKVHTPLSHQLEFFSETFCECAFQHGSINRIVWVIPHKVFPHLISVSVPLGRNLSTINSNSFLNGRDSLGIVARIPGYRVAVGGADGALAFIVKSIAVSVGGPLVCILKVWNRGEGNNGPPWGNFRGNVNGQPVAGGYVYGLRNAHIGSIA